MVRFGVIGYGYWGPNIVRNLRALENAEVVAVCDRRPDALKRCQKAYEDIWVTSDCSEVAELAGHRRGRGDYSGVDAFRAGEARAVQRQARFCGKTLHRDFAQAEELIELAEQKNLQIMVDHTFLFTGAVKKIRQLIDDNTLGKLYYYDSMRVNLGLFQHDVNVLWDLGAARLSIVDHLIGKRPEAIVATGEAHLNGLTTSRT